MDSCNYCGGHSSQLRRCTGCKSVVYCSRDHQKADWQTHKHACLHFQALQQRGEAWEKDVPENEYAGTFKWHDKKDFVQLPDWQEPAPLSGWQEYFGTRLAHVMGDKVILEPSMLDGLSFPLTVLWALHTLLHMDTGFKDSFFTEHKRLSIVCVGCSERAEEHVMRHTNYYTEIAHYMPRFQVDLWLVGPEMSSAGHLDRLQVTPSMSIQCFKGTTSKFLSHQGAHLAERKVIVVGFNTGMASGDDALKRSWSQDLRDLLARGWPCIFTCANDHTDLKCERQLMEKELCAKYILYPRKNVFGAVTTLYPPGRKETAWYSANAFLYGVQGCKGEAKKQHATGVSGAAAATADAHRSSASQLSTAHTTETEAPQEPAICSLLGSAVHQANQAASLPPTLAAECQAGSDGSNNITGGSSNSNSSSSSSSKAAASTAASHEAGGIPLSSGSNRVHQTSPTVTGLPDAGMAASAAIPATDDSYRAPLPCFTATSATATATSAAATSGSVGVDLCADIQSLELPKALQRESQQQEQEQQQQQSTGSTCRTEPLVLSTGQICEDAEDYDLYLPD